MLFTAQHIEIPVSIKPHALVANSMLVSKNMVTLYLHQNIFIVWRVTLVMWLLDANPPIARGLTCVILFLI